MMPIYVKKFLAQNEVTLEQIKDWPVPKLMTLWGMKTGRKTFDWLMREFGRTDAYPSPAVSADEKKNKAMAGRLRALKGIWFRYGVDNRKDFDALHISDEELLSHTGGETVTYSVDKEAEEIYQKYSSQFGITTANDEASLRNLAFLNARSGQLRAQLTAMATKKGDVTAKRATFVTKQLLDITKEARLLEASLGIDRPSREKEFDDPYSLMAQGLQDTAVILEREIQPIQHTCPDGILGPLIAQMWHFFPTHPHEPFMQACPRCGVRFEVKYKKRGEAVEMADFEVEILE